MAQPPPLASMIQSFSFFPPQTWTKSRPEACATSSKVTGDASPAVVPPPAGVAEGPASGRQADRARQSAAARAAPRYRAPRAGAARSRRGDIRPILSFRITRRPPLTGALSAQNPLESNTPICTVRAIGSTLRVSGSGTAGHSADSQAPNGLSRLEIWAFPPPDRLHVRLPSFFRPGSCDHGGREAR